MCYTTSPHNVPTEIERKGFVKIWHEWAVFSKSVTIKRRKFINLTISKNMHVRRKLSAFDKGRAISLLQEGHSLTSWQTPDWMWTTLLYSDFVTKLYRADVVKNVFELWATKKNKFKGRPKDSEAGCAAQTFNCEWA